jgi:DNA (cytosine-5)-methyltransferase 1
MGRLVEEVRPRAVMMENVAGLATKGRALLDAFIERLEGLGYIISKDVLQVADYGVPQTRRRFVLMAGLGFRVPIPPATHSRRGQRGLPLWRTVGDTIAGLPEPIVLSEAQAKGGAESFNWHVIRTMSPANRLRLRHTVPGKVRTCLPNKLRPDCHKGKDEGFTNVYGRLSWDSPSVTITGGCTTLSKGRFGHPEAERTISVREAALLQTFPKDYAISTPYMEKACDIVGNALPCVFAEILASAVCKALRMSKWPPPAEEEPTSFGKLSRSQLMARVGSVGNRTTEARLVSLLEAVKLEGWKLHDPLPGKPDFSWPELKVAVFVDGCFWHGHDCRNLTPRANAERWRAKILNNRRRDRQVVSELRAAGWSVIRIWECQLKREPAFCITRIKRVLTRRGGNRPLAAAAAKTAKEAKLSVRRRLEAVK